MSDEKVPVSIEENSKSLSAPSSHRKTVPEDKGIYQADRLHPNHSHPPYKLHGTLQPGSPVECKMASAPPRTKKIKPSKS